MASAAPFEPTLEIDNNDDVFSDYGSELESDTQSICSSLMEQYFEQNGRRYHIYFGPDKNPMPVDCVEQERLGMFHEMLYFCTGCKTHQAPVSGKEIQNVLDLGTGTGIWAIDFAQDHPHANVLGIDMTPIQPNWVPPNCRFEVDDFELDWTFKQKFDFVNARCISLSVRDWPRLIKQIKDNLNPGGFVEISDSHFDLKSDDNSIPPGYPAAKAVRLMADCLGKTNRMNPSAEHFRSLLEEAGFVNIVVKNYKIPVSPWPKNPALKQAGALYASQCQTGYEAYLLAMCTRVLHMPESEVIELCKKAAECHLDRRSRVHAYFDYPVVYGQKPEEVN